MHTHPIVLLVRALGEVAHHGQGVGAAAAGAGDVLVAVIVLADEIVRREVDVLAQPEDVLTGEFQGAEGFVDGIGFLGGLVKSEDTRMTAESR